MPLFAPDTQIYALRLGVGLVCGFLIGLERQWRHGMAGMRTHGLVSLGGAAFCTAGLLIPGDATAAARVASYVVSGVGFLCAGAIFREGATVKGLNTAATLWCAAAVGMLDGFGFFVMGLVMTLLVVATNAILRPLAEKWQPWAKNLPKDQHYLIRVGCGEFIEEHVRTLLLTSITRAPVRLAALQREEVPSSGQVVIGAEVVTEGQQDIEIDRIAAQLLMEPGITGAQWEYVGKSEGPAPIAPSAPNSTASSA
jgi:putative Mg2+ transporter-C (MgtC) family protein